MANALKTSIQLNLNCITASQQFLAPPTMPTSKGTFGGRYYLKNLHTIYNQNNITFYKGTSQGFD